MAGYYGLLMTIVVSFWLVNGRMIDLYDRKSNGKSKRAISYVGIPVPGQTVGGAEILNLYVNSCQSKVGSDAVLSDILNMISSSRGSQIAQQTYASLFYNLGEVDMTKLLGRWYTVAQSSVNNEACEVTYVNLIRNSSYLATATLRSYYRNDNGSGPVTTRDGQITKNGPDAGEILFQLGRDSEPCPYLLVKVGSLDNQERYSYLILTQVLKHPVIVLARDPYDFQTFYKREVEAFLEENGFSNQLTRTYTAVAFANTTQCTDAFYYHL